MATPSAATRIYTLERDSSRHELELHDHDNRINQAEKAIAVMAVRIGVFSAIGSFVGGGAIAVALSYLK